MQTNRQTTEQINTIANDNFYFVFFLLLLPLFLCLRGAWHTLSAVHCITIHYCNNPISIPCFIWNIRTVENQHLHASYICECFNACMCLVICVSICLWTMFYMFDRSVCLSFHWIGAFGEIPRIIGLINSEYQLWIWHFHLSSKRIFYRLYECFKAVLWFYNSFVFNRLSTQTRSKYRTFTMYLHVCIRIAQTRTP